MAVVSRGGRVDMAAEVRDDVQMPTLFIGGGADTQVLERNRAVSDRLACERDLHVVKEAGHLFEGKSDPEDVADSAADWFANALA